MVEELAQLVIWEVRILGKKEYKFTFMDGSKVKASCIGITGCGKGKPDFELSADSSNITLPESIAYSLKG